MTVTQLHKLLTKAIASGHGRLRVAVNKPSFTHPLEEDGCVFIDVSKAEVETVPLMDDDGGTAVTARGVERTVTFFALDGGNDPRLLENLNTQDDPHP